MNRSTSTRDPSLAAASDTATGSAALPPPSASARRASSGHASPRRVARALDPQRPGGGALSLDPRESERGSEVERLDLAAQVPLPGVSRGRHRPGDRRPSLPRAQEQGLELDAARRVPHLRLERVRVAAGGEVVSPDARARLRARRVARDLALGHERPRVRPVHARRRPEIGREGVHRGERQRRAPRAVHEALRAELHVRREPGTAGLGPRALERDGASCDPHAAGGGDGQAGSGGRRGQRGGWDATGMRRRCEGERAGRAEGDLAGASAPLDVPAGRGPAQRRVGAGDHRHGRAREGGGQGGDVEALGPHLDLGLLRGRERQRALRHQPPPVAPRFERLRHEAAQPSKCPRPLAAQGPTPFTVSARDVAESVPVSASSFTSTAASAPTRPTSPVPGASASTNAPSIASPTAAVAEVGEIRSTRPRRSIDDVPATSCARSIDQPPVVDHERGVGRLRLHPRPAVPSAHDRVGDPDRDAPLPGVVHHLRVHVAQHEEGRALHVAQLEPPVLDLGPRQFRKRLPRPRRQPRGRRLRRHRPPRVAHHDLRPEEADVRPRPRGPGDVDPLRLEGDAFERQARRRRGCAPLPEVELELAEAQRAADRARSPLLEEHARGRAAGRRVQEGERQRDSEKEEETQAHSEPHDPAEPGPSPRRGPGFVTTRRRSRYRAAWACRRQGYPLRPSGFPGRSLF